MPDITGLFEHRRGAEQAVAYLKEIGIDPAEIAVVAYDPTAEPTHHPDAKQSATAGASAGTLIGGVGGALAGLGLIAIPGAGPLVASGWLLTAISGAVAGAATGGTAGSALGFLISNDFEEPEHINRELQKGATVVRASVPDDRFFKVTDAFQKLAKA